MKFIDSLQYAFRERSLRREIAIVQSYPDQVVIEGTRSLMLFQPHHTDHYDSRLFNTCKHTITHKIQQWVGKGKNVFFVLEDGTKGHLAHKRKVLAAERTGSTKRAAIDLAILQQEAEEGNGEAAYLLYYRSLLYTLLEQNNKDGSPTRIWTLTEAMPKIQMVGSNSFRELKPTSQNLDQSRKRFQQITAFGATRDLALAGQIIRELQKDPFSAFILIRGTEHLGITTCLETMAELTYPDIKGIFGDIDQERETRCLIDLTSIASRPITWSRLFWKRIFESNPYLLKLPETFYPGMDMQSTMGLIRKLLSEDPWMPFITRALTDIAQSPPGLYVGHSMLSQQMFF